MVHELALSKDRRHPISDLVGMLHRQSRQAAQLLQTEDARMLKFLADFLAETLPGQMQAEEDACEHCEAPDLHEDRKR